jgi:hypothetical protein
MQAAAIVIVIESSSRFTDDPYYSQDVSANNA